MLFFLSLAVFYLSSKKIKNLNESWVKIVTVLFCLKFKVDSEHCLPSYKKRKDKHFVAILKLNPFIARILVTLISAHCSSLT